MDGGLYEHAVEAEARGPQQVRRGQALAGEPVRPVGIPSQVVEQRPVVVQVGRAAGAAAGREQGGAADGAQVLLVERLLEQGVLAPGDGARGGGLAGVGEPGVEVAAVGVDAAMVGFDLDGDGVVDGLERGEPWHEPLLGDGLDGDDADASGPAALAFGDAVDLVEDALHLLEVGPPAVVESHAPRPAVEQRDVEVFLEHADAVGDGGRGDAELGPGAGEALVRVAASKKRRLSSGGRSSTAATPPRWPLAFGRMFSCDRTLARWWQAGLWRGNRGKGSRVSKRETTSTPLTFGGFGTGRHHYARNCTELVAGMTA